MCKILETIDKMNKAFDRKDLGSFCEKKKTNGAIFDKIIKDFIHPKTGQTYGIHITNDPEKMLGCGFRILSSYSPRSQSFKYLPTFVLQDYIGMLYITDEKELTINVKGNEFKAPNYLARAFVMLNPDTSYILCKMPTYTDDDFLYSVFDFIKEKGFGIIKSNTYPPEIHLDCLDLYYSDLFNGNHPKSHIAVCGIRMPCIEYYKDKGYKI